MTARTLADGLIVAGSLGFMVVAGVDALAGRWLLSTSPLGSWLVNAGARGGGGRPAALSLSARVAGATRARFALLSAGFLT